MEKLRNKANICTAFTILSYTFKKVIVVFEFYSEFNVVLKQDINCFELKQDSNNLP